MPPSPISACGPGGAAGFKARQGDQETCLTARRSSHRLLPSRWQDAEAKRTFSWCYVTPSFLSRYTSTSRIRRARPRHQELLSSGGGITEVQTARPSQVPVLGRESRTMFPSTPAVGGDPHAQLLLGVWILPPCSQVSCSKHPATCPSPGAGSTFWVLSSLVTPWGNCPEENTSFLEHPLYRWFFS